MKEYPIDEKFWEWWKSYFHENIDLRQNLCYNLNVEKEKENNPNEADTISE